MKLHLLDATYELFRAFHGVEPARSPDGREVAAVGGLLGTTLSLLREADVTHLATATDHVIRSFRNDLWLGYKTEEGVPEDLLAQFPLAERALESIGVMVWPMVEFEADDALATAAARFKDEPGVEQVLICSPDKDLAQSVIGSHVVGWDRRRDIVLDEVGVVKKFGVTPSSIPDWLALVGDSADGYPGLPGWGAKSAAAVLSRFGHLESISEDPSRWGLPTGRAARLAETLRSHRKEALLFRRLATLRTDVPLVEELADLEWRGAQPRLKEILQEWNENDLLQRIPRWQKGAH